MFCKVCKIGVTQTKDYKIGSHSICTECGDETIYYEQYCCSGPEYIATRKYADDFEAQIGGNNYTVWNQCQNCGVKKGTALKKSENPIESTQTFSYHLLEQTEELKKEFYKIIKGIDERKHEDQTHTFWNNYNEYLQSDEWKSKREIVLKRDKNKCQSCLKETATQVHHKEGKFRMNEPLFTLVSVCDKCHDIITQIERGNKDVGKIEYE